MMSAYFTYVVVRKYILNISEINKQHPGMYYLYIASKLVSMVLDFSLLIMFICMVYFFLKRNSLVRQ